MMFLEKPLGVSGMGSKRPYEDDNLRGIVIASVAAVLAVEATKLDVRQSFLYHGGHSLLAIALSSKCRSRGVLLSVESILRSVSVTELVNLAHATDQYCSVGSKRQKLLASSMSNNRRDSPTLARDYGRSRTLEPVQKLSIAGLEVETSVESYELTEMQMALLSGSQRDPGSNTIQFFDTFATPHIPAMKRAWKYVVELEPIFRLCQTSKSNESSSTNKEILFKWSEVSYDNLSDYHAALDEVSLEASITTSFKAVTIKQESMPDITTIIWSVHHTLMDGYSASLVYKKVRRAAEGHPIWPGKSFFKVANDLKSLQEKLSVPCQRFWAQQKIRFPSVSGEILLPHPAATAPDLAKTRSLSVPAEGHGILSYCRQHGVTIAAFHYSAWALVLSKYCDSDSVMFGAVVSGRSLPIEGIEDTVGPLINTLPFYASIIKAENTKNYIQNVFAQMVQLEPLQASMPKDGYLREFSSAVAMDVEISYSENSVIQPIAENSFKANSDIPITILIRQDGTARLSYRTQRFTHKDVELLVEHYSNALNRLLQPDIAMGRALSTLAPRKSLEFLLQASNFSSMITTREAVFDDLVTLFEANVVRNATAVAVELQDIQLSYAELDAQAGNVAYYLERVIKAGDVVCVHADRSVNWIIAIYGILKASGVYAPFDPSLPEKTREVNYQTANGSIYLTPGSSQKVFAPSVCSLVLSVEDILASATYDSLETRKSHQQRPKPDASAYICFTSGTTGVPKGVLCHHAGLVAFQMEKEVRLFAEPGCRIAQVMSPAFDGSIHEIFSALSYGATLVLPGSRDMTSHLSTVTSAILTPSLAKVLDPNDYPLLQNVYLVGEPVPQQINDAWACSKNLYNMYGPTEATCGATIKRLECGNGVTVGRPNPSSRVYILDRHREMCPPGVIGDIYIAGVQVGRGYLNRPKETLQRFLPDSLCSNSNEMMYWTGDRGYWDLSMEIHCLGRKDRQIKLNGFRLDLNALEDQISRDVPEITAIALVRKADYLLAVVQPASLDVQNLKLQVSQSLPPYALPRYIVTLDKFPTTTAGKLDYAALVRLPTAENNTLSIQWTDTETIIATIWRDVLNLADQALLTPESSFVALGGHSISQLLLANRMSSVFKRPVKLHVIMESQTLRDLASAIDQLLSSDTGEPQKTQYLTSSPEDVSSIEAEWVLKYQVREGSSAFNVSVAWVFDPKSIDRRRLEDAWNDTIDQHRILHSRYAGKTVQTVKRKYHDKPPRVQCVKGINVAEEINHPFQVDKDHLIRVLISASQMVVSISHLICDLTTLRSLLSEVASRYLKTSSSPLSRSETRQLTIRGESAEFACHLDFWSTYLQDPSPIEFFQRSIPARRTYAGASDMRRVPPKLFARLCKYAKTHSYTLHQLGLAAICLASQPDFELLDLVVGAPYINRQPEDMETIGLFLEPLPIRVKYRPTERNESMRAFVDHVRRSSQAAVAHAVPWSNLLRHLNAVAEFPNHPLFDIMVTFHDNRSATLFQLPSFEQLHTWSNGSKFKIMFEFTAYSDDSLTLRIEYDNQCFTASEVVRLQVLVVKALESIVADTALSEFRSRLRSQVSNIGEVCSLQAVNIGSLVDKI